MSEFKSAAEIERSFDDALAAIVAAVATPQKIKLRTKSLERRRQIGTLRLSISSVAEQAGHARRLIASENEDSPYAAVRSRIIAAIGPKEKVKKQRETIDELRKQVAALKQKVRARDARNMELVDRLEKQRVTDKLGVQEQERIAARPDDYDPDEDWDEEGDGDV